MESHTVKSHRYGGPGGTTLADSGGVSDARSYKGPCDTFSTTLWLSYEIRVQNRTVSSREGFLARPCTHPRCAEAAEEAICLPNSSLSEGGWQKQRNLPPLPAPPTSPSLFRIEVFPLENEANLLQGFPSNLLWGRDSISEGARGQEATISFSWRR